jgi:hypothetical protein
VGGSIIEICLFQIVLSGLAGRVDLYEHIIAGRCRY